MLSHIIVGTPQPSPHGLQYVEHTQEKPGFRENLLEGLPQSSAVIRHDDLRLFPSKKATARQKGLQELKPRCNGGLAL